VGLFDDKKKRRKLSLESKFHSILQDRKRNKNDHPKSEISLKQRRNLDFILFISNLYLLILSGEM
jgi:hypothetical protein